MLPLGGSFSLCLCISVCASVSLSVSIPLSLSVHLSLFLRRLSCGKPTVSAKPLSAEFPSQPSPHPGESPPLQEARGSECRPPKGAGHRHMHAGVPCVPRRCPGLRAPTHAHTPQTHTAPRSIPQAPALAASPHSLGLRAALGLSDFTAFSEREGHGWRRPFTSAPQKAARGGAQVGRKQIRKPKAQRPCWQGRG